MASSRVDRISSVHWWLPHKDIGVMLRQAHSTFSDDFQGEEIQEMMGRNFGVEFDEWELMDELNELDEEIIGD